MGDFAGFCALIGAPEIADDPRFADFASRLEHRDELDADIGDAFRARTTAEWVERLAEIVPCGPVLAHRRGVRRSAGAAPRADPHGRRTRRAARSTCCARRSRSATRRRPSGAVRRRRARTRARCWPSSATTTPRSTSCTRRARSPRSRRVTRTVTARVDTGTEKMLAHVEDGIGWMTYNNPARLNAMSFDMQIAVPRILAAFADDPDVHVIVVTGAGEPGVRVGRRHLRVLREAHDGRCARRLRRGAGRRVGLVARARQADPRDDPRLLHRRRAAHRDEGRHPHRRRGQPVRRCPRPGSASGTRSAGSRSSWPSSVRRGRRRSSSRRGGCRPTRRCASGWSTASCPSTSSRRRCASSRRDRRRTRRSPCRRARPRSARRARPPADRDRARSTDGRGVLPLRGLPRGAGRVRREARAALPRR